MAILFVPLAMNLHHVYPWVKQPVFAGLSFADGAKEQPLAAAGEKAAAEESAGGEPHSAAGRDAWLTPVRFLGRFVIYFVIWAFLAWYLRGHSILQDRIDGVALSKRMERLTAPGMILFGVTITLAAVDLIMSLNPHWSSTMIGVYLFADAVLSSLVALALLAMWLQSNGLLRGAITKEHYHDLGKLTLGFVVFWAYIAFSQYMLIWYANMPEETQFYMMRQIGPWAAVSLVLVVVHFVLPFLGLMSRRAKRFLPLFAFWLVWLLAAHAFDLFWLIMPNVFLRQISVNPAAAGIVQDDSPIAAIGLSTQPGVAVGRRREGPAAAGGYRDGRRPAGRHGRAFCGKYRPAAPRGRLVPVKDPRLAESLSFHNT